MPSRCLVIPALAQHGAIPDHLVKRLAGKTLMQRALDTGLGVVAAQDLFVVTDSAEIALIAERAGVRVRRDPHPRAAGLDILRALREVLADLARDYDVVLVYRAACPLVTAADIQEAWSHFCASGADCLVTVKSVRQRVWQAQGSGEAARLVQVDSLFGCDSPDGCPDTELLVESRALTILASRVLDSALPPRVVPFFLNDRAVEINSYQDWWICERLLLRRHVVFVVAGYPAIGMGHIFRALMLAHEIADHKVSFVCTRESELAATSIAARDYKTFSQGTRDLASAVLDLEPDLVINDILDTTRPYMESLRQAGVPVVNFEDEGPGAALAQLVVNALYEERAPRPGLLAGHTCFCLRDEFLGATRNLFADRVGRVLVTFGGTDDPDFTRQTLDVVEPLCRERDIEIRVVTGPGYAHREALEAHLATLANPRLVFTSATNVMSRMMEGVDLAISSAGRTVYELAHMRIPALILAQNERENRHTFARARNGFAYLGVMRPFRAARLRAVFAGLVNNQQVRRRLFERQADIDFSRNKRLVVDRILALLPDADGARG